MGELRASTSYVGVNRGKEEGEKGQGEREGGREGGKEGGMEGLVLSLLPLSNAFLSKLFNELLFIVQSLACFVFFHYFFFF